MRELVRYCAACLSVSLRAPLCLVLEFQTTTRIGGGCPLASNFFFDVAETFSDRAKLVGLETSTIEDRLRHVLEEDAVMVMPNPLLSQDVRTGDIAGDQARWDAASKAWTFETCTADSARVNTVFEGLERLANEGRAGFVAEGETLLC